MKQSRSSYIKLMLVVSIMHMAFFAKAQNRPKIQEVSLRATDKVKIDGKLTEWPDKLQAYNFTNRIFYEIANDDDKLYVIIRTSGPFANDKIMKGGISFIVSHSTDKKTRLKANDNIAITYPLLTISDGFRMSETQYEYQDLKNDTTGNKLWIDSLTDAINKHGGDLFKEIKVTGISTITDSVISIYNTDGIKAAGRFNNKMFYIYELAIPLKSLGLSVDVVKAFSYCIRLNGPPPMPAIPGNPDESTIKVVDPEFEYRNSPTEFWAEYILARKP